MTAKSLAVAQYIVGQMKAVHGAHPTPMKLLKLVYIAHGYMLGRHGSPLVDEQVQAFSYGPVVESVYETVRGFRDQPVGGIKGAHIWSGEFSQNERGVMDHAVQHYGVHDALMLSRAMHQPGTPWSITRNTSKGSSPISNDLISHFYSGLLKQREHGSL